jgi:hypothetical protein
MIDWLSLFWNSLWVLGSAVILAVLSYHHWLAHEQGVRWRAQLETAAFQRPFWAGFSLIALGLAGTSPTWWETTLWAGFALYALFNIWTTLTTTH